MDHVAIMRKSWNLTPKVLNREKTIESRWYTAKCAPWNRVKSGETVYFKDSGDSVTVKAEIEKVLQFSNLTPEKVNKILEKYGKKLGIENIHKFAELFKDKKYCILVFLKNPEKTKPFEINKNGFGIMAAWICVDDIDKIKSI